MIPADRDERKRRPMARGVLDYFPDALADVAYCSWVGNEQHNPGEELHWAKEKSTDEADALLRHLAQRGTLDDDGVRHSAKVAWRALALLQREIDAEKAQAEALKGTERYVESLQVRVEETPEAFRVWQVRPEGGEHLVRVYGKATCSSSQAAYAQYHFDEGLVHG